MTKEVLKAISHALLKYQKLLLKDDSQVITALRLVGIIYSLGRPTDQEFLRDMGPVAREWLFSTLADYAPERAPIYGQKNKPNYMTSLDVYNCCLCHTWHHSLDMDETGFFCPKCAKDLVFLGYKLHETGRRLQRGGELGEAPKKSLDQIIPR